jgi:hypothetical protein
MRQRFEQQMRIGTVAIREVKFPLKSRDELPPVLKALQHIFITPQFNEKMFALLEGKICKGKKKTGRRGMDLWHVLVLAVIRHTLNTNWDRLHLVANYDELCRSILGVHGSTFYGDKIEFNYQNILDNVSLLDEKLLEDINEIVVDAMRQLVKKEEDTSLKTDSYALETDVHFPTDLNLFWDGLRKCLDMVKALKEQTGLKGWRKIKHIRSELKSQFRKTSHQVFKGRKEDQKRKSVKEYLSQARSALSRFESIINDPPVNVEHPEKVAILIAELKRYTEFVKKFSGQIERRLLKGEVIAADEKIYSIFEEHTEWITKGKLNKKVELGHLLLITTDQHHCIVDYKIMEKQKDATQIKDLQKRLDEKYKGRNIKSHSFDKGFWSKDNLKTLQESKTEHVVLPKRGKLNKEEKERQSDKTFKKLRNAHSAVESNINMLEHHGLNRCYDKGMKGFKRCVGLSVLAYNLHHLGNALLEKEREKDRRKQKALAKAA